MDNKTPLGLPPGSVRAFLVALPVVTVCLLAFVTRQADLVSLVKELALAGSVGYGLMRASAGNTPPAPPAP
jgi:hypothetical protein